MQYNPRNHGKLGFNSARNPSISPQFGHGIAERPAATSIDRTARKKKKKVGSSAVPPTAVFVAILAPFFRVNTKQLGENVAVKWEREKHLWPTQSGCQMVNPGLS